MSIKDEALLYHEKPTPGKIAVVPTKPCFTSRDLSLAYSPGVAEPCLAIEKNKEDVYRYTSKGNLVAVISNGTAVLGLGDIGPEASKPVMEGKGVLFKAFADIDVFDIELNAREVDYFVETVVALAPTFGGINLEDIKAPDCFYIEQKLKERLDIPVFHDDQHGTAIIAGAGLLNAIEVTERDIKKIKLVVSGAGASAIACSRLLFSLGLPKENLTMVDTKGVIYRGRIEGMNEFKEEFAIETDNRTLSDAMKGADVFFGLSVKDMLTPEMLLSMADNPIVFAMANPDPEIDYHLAKATRSDAILATGRSDYPNQVNNVLGFPFIFRGALDVRASTINEEMKMAAVKALAQLAKEPVTPNVRKAYGNSDFTFGPEYLIPKPFDPRVLYYVAPAVAQAAMDSGVARQQIDMDEYILSLKGKENQGRATLKGYHSLARRSSNKRIAYAEGDNPQVMKAAQMALQEGVAIPVLIGKQHSIVAKAKKIDLDITQFEIVEPSQDRRYEAYVDQYYSLTARSGNTHSEALYDMRQAHIFGNMLLRNAEVDGLICGVDRYYPEMIRPILKIIGLQQGISSPAGLYLVSTKDRLLFFSDTTVNVEMNSEKLSNIAIMTAEFAKSMDIEPRIAMLSYSNFGSVKNETSNMVREATRLVKQKAPHLKVDGEMQADTALVEDILKEHYEFSDLDKPANVLIFPDMQSANISYKLMHRVGGAHVVGPIILGLNKPAYVMQRHANTEEIFNMTTVAVAQASLACAV